jgi:hypothetical protein
MSASERGTKSCRHINSGYLRMNRRGNSINYGRFCPLDNTYVYLHVDKTRAAPLICTGD